jgi:hypothetical protein
MVCETRLRHYESLMVGHPSASVSSPSAGPGEQDQPLELSEHELQDIEALRSSSSP